MDEWKFRRELEDMFCERAEHVSQLEHTFVAICRDPCDLASDVLRLLRDKGLVR